MASKNIKKTKQVSYNATIDLSLKYEDQNILNIERERIKQLVINFEYSNPSLPIPEILVTLNVNANTYKIIDEYRDTAKIFLNIKRRAVNSNTSLFKSIIKGDFNYICSSVGASKSDILDSGSEDSYRQIILGLLPINVLNKFRTLFNGNRVNTTTSNLIAEALEGTDPIIEKITNNDSYNTIIIPPVNNIKKFLSFIFNKKPFFDTGFRFYMDFNHAYLLSKNGNYVNDGTNNPGSIIFNIMQLDDFNALEEGVNISDTAYTVNINPKYFNIIKNEVLGKKTNNIITIDESGNANVDLDVDSMVDKNKAVFVRSNDTSVLKNETEGNSILVEIGKSFIDPSIITPNKSFSIKNFSGNSIYDGKYLIAYKRVVLSPTAQEFMISTMIGLSKIGKLEEVGLDKFNNKVYKKKENKAVKSSSKKTSTANKRGRLTTTKAR